MDWNKIEEYSDKEVQQTLNKIDHVLLSEQSDIVFSNTEIHSIKKALTNYQDIKFEKYSANTVAKYNFNKKLYLKLGTIAATVIVLIGMGIISQLSHTHQQVEPSHRSFQPGVSEAYLTLYNGQNIILNYKLTDTIQTNDGKIILNKATINCLNNKNTTKTEQVKWNKIVVPRGGEYQLTLNDGSHIWLNSESELEFPIHFNSDQRIVKLKGEAYFDVSSNQKLPFTVITKQGNITVLGTEFNINLYQPDCLVTTLVKGAIEYSNLKNRSIKLNPGEQLSYKQGDSFPRILTVNTNIYCSWKDNLFYFEDQTLEEIMYILSRWYNFHYFFKDNSVREIKLSGKLDRYANVASLLTLFEKSAPISFEIKDHIIWIRSQQKQ